MQHIVYSGLFV